MEERNDKIFYAAQDILSGMVAGSFFSISIVNAMQANTRTTLGHILVNEAWDMAETLVSRYERESAEKGI